MNQSRAYHLRDIRKVFEANTFDCDAGKKNRSSIMEIAVVEIVAHRVVEKLEKFYCSVQILLEGILSSFIRIAYK